MAEVEAWAAGLAEVHARIAPRFARSEPRERVLAYVQGLLAPLERKNSWTLAERAGERIPDGMQRLLAYADWDADAVRDDVRDYVVEHLGDPGGVLVVDETGFLKKGTKSAGVARSVLGTAGRIENCQIGVFLGYATPAGRTFLDRELYLPKTWAEDHERRAQARVGEEVKFATKPEEELAMAMIARALDAQVPAGWVTGDEVYGPALQAPQDARRTPDALRHGGSGQPAGDRATQREGPRSFVRCAGGAATGTGLEENLRRSRPPGPARVPLGPAPSPVPLEDTRSYWLLVRRSLTDPDDLAYYLCHGPERTPLHELVRVAGARWAIEETFQTAKGQVGLDQYQVRRYDSWYDNSPWRCSRTPSSPSPPPTPAQKGGSPHRRGADPADRA